MPPRPFPQPHLPDRHCPQQATQTLRFVVYDSTADGPQWHVQAQPRPHPQKRHDCLQHAHRIADRLTAQIPPRPQEG